MKHIFVAFCCIFLLSACRTSTTPAAAPTATPSPSATPTAASSATATVSPTPTLPSGYYAAVTFTPVAGWKTYVNDTLGYQFNYPANGNIEEWGVISGGPEEEAAQFGMDIWEYLRYLIRTLPGDLCVSVELLGGGITIRPPWEPLGKFTHPCPGMGIGAVRLEKATDTFDVGGRSYAADGEQIFNEETDKRIGEFYFIEVDNGFYITYNCLSGSEDSPLERTLRQILSSIQWTAPPPSAVPTPTCAGAYTRLLPGRYAVVTGGPDDPPNRVRSAPNTGAEVVAQIYPGTSVQVLEGPVCADGLVFWKVENASIPSGAGWTAEGDGSEYFLEPYRP